MLLCFSGLWMSCYCKFSLALSHNAVGWYAVCACGISCSCSVTFLLSLLLFIGFLFWDIVLCYPKNCSGLPRFIFCLVDKLVTFHSELPCFGFSLIYSVFVVASILSMLSA